MTPCVGGLHHSAAGPITHQAGQSIVIRESLVSPIGDIRQVWIISAGQRREIPIDDIGGDEPPPEAAQAVYFDEDVVGNALLHAREVTVNVTVAESGIHQSKIGEVTAKCLSLKSRKLGRDRGKIVTPAYRQRQQGND